MSEQTHDYSADNRHWGHDYTFRPKDGGKRGSIIGWGHGISDGDFLILDDPKGGTTRYQVESVRYAGDPRDMWSADAVFAPRVAEEKTKP